MCRQTLDVLAVVVVLSRSRFNLLHPDNACVLVAGSTGVAFALVWLLVPSLRPRWRALVAGAKWWRQASYIMGKAMVRGGLSSPFTQPNNIFLHGINAVDSATYAWKRVPVRRVSRPSSGRVLSVAPVCSVVLLNPGGSSHVSTAPGGPLGLSIVKVRHIRYATYYYISTVLPSPQVAFLGFRQPPATCVHELSATIFVIEGVILPASCLVSLLMSHSSFASCGMGRTLTSCMLECFGRLAGACGCVSTT